jgi:hypothetical protein
MEFVDRAEELRRHLGDIAATTPLAVNSLNNGSSSSSAQNAGEAQKSSCVVCMCATRTVVFIPCGHYAVCQSCYLRLQQCPICRSVIRGGIRSYMS